MASPSPNKRRNVVSPKSAEKSALNLIAEEADSREAKSQEVLSEARKIRSSERMKDKNSEDAEDEDTLLENGHTTIQKKNSLPIKPIAKVAIPEENNKPPMTVTTDTTELQERFKHVMLVNAQVDNECRMLKYHTDLLKDELDTSNESNMQLKDKIKRLQHDKNKMDLDMKDLKYQLKQLQYNVQQKDSIIKEHGFSMVTVDSVNTHINGGASNTSEMSIISPAQLDMLSEYNGSLGSRLQQLYEDRNTSLEMSRTLQKQLDEARTTITNTPNPPSSSSASSSPNFLADNPLENNQNQFIETKYKLKKAEQEITTLQGAVTRLETQLTRYKSSSESLEKIEEDLKVDKRKLQLELRDCRTTIEELQTKNNHLMKRVEKMKSSRIQEALQ